MSSYVGFKDVIKLSPELLLHPELNQALRPVIENTEQLLTRTENLCNTGKDMCLILANELDNFQDKTRKGVHVRQIELKAKHQQRFLVNAREYNAGMKAQLNKVKQCARILDEHAGSVETLAHSDLSMSESDLTTNLSKQAEQADRVFAELMQEQTPCKTLSASKKKTKKSQKSRLTQTTQASSNPPQGLSPLKVSKIFYSGNELAQQIMQLNSSHSQMYRLHPRVQRWKYADFDDIKKFVDYKKDTLENPYADMDDSNLKYQKDTHNVGWIKEIIAGPLGNMYSFNHQYSTTQRGKSLFATMHRAKEIKTGLIVLGISADCMIYHAQFRPFLHEDIVPSYVASLLQVAPLANADAETKFSEDSEWEHTSKIAFSLVDKNVIHIKSTVFKPTEKETFYRVYPLHD